MQFKADSVEDKRFGATIWLHRSATYGNAECVIQWKDYPFQTFQRWQWYFRYRAALVQIQYPKYRVELSTFSYAYVPSVAEQRKRLRDRITAKKAKLTQWRNAFDELRRNWNSLFPVEEDPRYPATVEKIESLSAELQCMERELEQLIEIK